MRRSNCPTHLYGLEMVLITIKAEVQVVRLGFNSLRVHHYKAYWEEDK